MSRKKEYFLIIDTETANDIDQPLPYDIGYAICDRQGNIYLARSFVVAEIFLDYQDLMQSAYYAEKIPQYWEDIKKGIRKVAPILKIRKQLHADMKEYNVKTVGAYNMGFDKKALNNVTRYCSKSFVRWFFPYGTEYICIWHMACQVLMDSMNYVRFCHKNGLVKEETGNIMTSAETCYKYIKNKVDFIEEHTGLEDVRIEIEILAKCFKTHKKMDKGINSLCWRIPQKKNKERGNVGV